MGWCWATPSHCSPRRQSAQNLAAPRLALALHLCILNPQDSTSLHIEFQTSDASGGGRHKYESAPAPRPLAPSPRTAPPPIQCRHIAGSTTGRLAQPQA